MADPTVRIGTIVFLALISPFLLPILHAEALNSYSNLVEIPLLGLVVVSFPYRLQQIQDRSERRFWNLWSLGFVIWLAQELLALRTGDGASGLDEFDIFRDSLFFLFYVALALGLESQPHAR